MIRKCKKILLRILTKVLGHWDYDLQKRQSNRILFPDLDPEFWDLYEKAAPYTLTSIERMYALYVAVKYIVQNKIPGDLCECGVWKGGSSMLIASTLLHFKDVNRKIYLYDTFEGMTEPTAKDVDLNGIQAADLLSKERETSINWAYSPLDEVKKNMQSTAYNENQLIFVKGKVEDTIPGTIPTQIALLRLDTDWYESTKHELEYLYPRVAQKGILIIDDYGHFKGCKEATDEYFNSNIPLLHRIDYTGRILQKI